MQLKVTNLKLCITGGRGSNKEISLFLDSENCSNFRLIQHNNDYDIQVMTYKFKKYIFFGLPCIHVYEYYVKMAVIFLTIIFNEKVDP